MLDRTAVERIERMKTETTDIILKMALRHSAVAVVIAFDSRLSLSASVSDYSSVGAAGGRSGKK